MTDLLAFGSDVRWPDLLRIADGDDIPSMLGRLLAHGQSLVPVAGLSVCLPGPADPLEAMLEDRTGVRAADDPQTRLSGEPATVIASAELAAGLTRLQVALGEGPARDAVAQGELVAVDLRTSGACWPRFTDAAAEIGVCCVVSVPLTRPDESFVGVLSAYAREPMPAGSDTVLVALAAHASVIVETFAVYLDARGDAARLQDALVTNSVIEQAKGVLIMRERITAQLAEEYLRKTSEATHREIRDIAAELVSRAANGTLR